MNQQAGPLWNAAGTSASASATGAKGRETGPAYLSLRYATAMIANAADSVEPAVEAVLERVCLEGGYPLARAYVHLASIGEESQSSVWLLHRAYRSGGDMRTDSEIMQQPGPPAEGPAGEALRLGAAVWRSRYDASALGIPDLGKRACVCALPIFHNETAVGVLEFFGSAPCARDEDWVEALTDIASQLGHLVGRVRAQMRALRQQAGLARMSRVASMREVAGSLAHEVNQPLAAIVNYSGGALHLLEQGRADDEKLARVLDQVRIQAKRASGIIQDLRELLRHNDGRQDRLDLNQLIQRTADLLETTARDAGVKLRLELEENLPEIVGDDIQLQQVLINLVVNAIEAMDHSCAGRDVLISTRAGEQIEVVVSDRGPGMHDELLAKLFTPFFSTKPHGLGIGLSISRSIVEFHGGRLSGANNPDQGMSFRIRLPRVTNCPHA